MREGARLVGARYTPRVDDPGTIALGVGQRFLEGLDQFVTELAHR